MKKTVLILLICLAIVSMPASAGEAQFVAVPIEPAGTARISPQTTGRQGTRGRLFIGDFSVALFESAGPDAVAIVDAEDSACWFMWYESESPIIADHCTQGFDILESCEVGDVCYIVAGEDLTEYVCVDVDHEGVNERHDMYLSSGYNFMRGNDPGYLYMYTCNEPGDPYHITVVTWTPR